MKTVWTPCIWLILLADSSAGKTWTIKKIREKCGIEEPEIKGLSGAASPANFFHKIHTQPAGLWLHDEFGQFIARLEKNVQDTEMKEYVLKLYDGDGLVRGTMKDGDRDTGPTRVCVMGLSQPQNLAFDGSSERNARWHRAKIQLFGRSSRRGPRPARLCRLEGRFRDVEGAVGGVSWLATAFLSGPARMRWNFFARLSENLLGRSYKNHSIEGFSTQPTDLQ